MPDTDTERLRDALERIQQRHALADDWAQGHPTDISQHWHDGYITGLATCSLIAREALDPDGWAEHQHEQHLATHATDRQWFAQTGRCGHCGNLAAWCACTPDDPCGCGPHELSAEPLPCGWCKGTGVAIRPRGPAGA